MKYLILALFDQSFLMQLIALPHARNELAAVLPKTYHIISNAADIRNNNMLVLFAQERDCLRYVDNVDGKFTAIFAHIAAQQLGTAQS